MSLRQFRDGPNVIRHFINLTNGIEAIEEYELSGDEVEFIRISSTDCEHKLGAPQWDSILAELDVGFLLALARGDTCIVYDYSKLRKQSRAQTYGLLWIMFALNLSWFRRDSSPVMIDGEDMGGMFRRIWRTRVGRRTKKKLAYFQHFLTTDEVRLRAEPGQTKRDRDWEYYLRVLRDAGR